MIKKHSPRVAIMFSEAPNEKLREQIANGQAPRRDYLMIQDIYNADFLFPKKRTSLGDLLSKIMKTDWDGAWEGFKNRKDYDMILSQSEQIGLPLGALLGLSRSKTKHIMIGHQPAVWKKIIFMYLTGAFHGIDNIVCYGQLQARLLKKRLVFLKDEQISVILHPADQHFWKPAAQRLKNSIVAAGLEYRDYPTFLEAIDGLNVDVFIAAASPWSRRKDETKQRTIPENTKIGRLKQDELKKKLEEATIVAVPLKPMDFQAGSLVMYEAMAAGNAVVASRTPSHAEGEIIQNEENGLLVPPGEPQLLRDAIERLLNNEKLRNKLGNAARKTVENGLNIDKYITQLTSVIDRYLED